MDQEQIAIMRLKEASEMSLKFYSRPLLVTTSGGKDSSVCTALAERAGIPFEVMHNLTTADAPETVYFVRAELHRLELKGIRCDLNYPSYKGQRTSMWQLIPQKLMPPTRLVRYCCDILKESSGANRFITTGVRWHESKKREDTRGIYETQHRDIKKRVILSSDNDERRKLFENCRLKAKRVCNPIIDWTDRDVWDYINSEHITVNPLYQCGFSRVGCVGCPMAGTSGRYLEFARYPKYRQNYIRAFDRMIVERRKKGLLCGWDNGTDVFHWWMEDGVIPGQIGFDELLGKTIFEGGSG